MIQQPLAEYANRWRSKAGSIAYAHPIHMHKQKPSILAGWRGLERIESLNIQSYTAHACDHKNRTKKLLMQGIRVAIFVFSVWLLDAL